jgi:hypothetical protein
MQRQGAVISEFDLVRLITSEEMAALIELSDLGFEFIKGNKAQWDVTLAQMES